VHRKVVELFPFLPSGALVLLFVADAGGSVGAPGDAGASGGPRTRPALCVFAGETCGWVLRSRSSWNPTRIIAGCRTAADRELLREAVYTQSPNKVEWMGVESAEMTKHAINSFLALSVCFINEIAHALRTLRRRCRRSGARAEDGGRASGPRPTCRRVARFAGGTLARDVAFLSQMGQAADIPVQLIRAIRASNDAHRAWALQRLRELWSGELSGKRVAVWA